MSADSAISINGVLIHPLDEVTPDFAFQFFRGDGKNVLNQEVLIRKKFKETIVFTC